MMKQNVVKLMNEGLIFFKLQCLIDSHYQILNRRYSESISCHYTVCSKKSDAKMEITTTATILIRIKYFLSIVNYYLSDANVANFNKIHCIVFEQQLFKKWNSKTEVSNMEKSP